MIYNSYLVAVYGTWEWNSSLMNYVMKLIVLSSKNMWLLVN